MVCLPVPKSIQSVPNNAHPVLNEEKCNEYLSGLLRKRSWESELSAREIIVGDCTEKTHRIENYWEGHRETTSSALFMFVL